MQSVQAGCATASGIQSYSLHVWAPFTSRRSPFSARSVVAGGRRRLGSLAVRYPMPARSARARPPPYIADSYPAISFGAVSARQASRRLCRPRAWRRPRLPSLIAGLYAPDLLRIAAHGHAPHRSLRSRPPTALNTPTG